MMVVMLSTLVSWWLQQFDPAFPIQHQVRTFLKLTGLLSMHNRQNITMTIAILTTLADECPQLNLCFDAYLKNVD